MVVRDFWHGHPAIWPSSHLAIQRDWSVHYLLTETSLPKDQLTEI